MALDIQAVLQPQHAELFLVELAVQEAAGLVGELHDPFVDQPLVDLVIDIHGEGLLAPAR
ncbi:hypothetical protein D3C81_1867930 [compost metagenome]